MSLFFKGTIANGSNVPLNVKTGTTPDVSGALKDTFQLMTFEPVAKEVDGFQVLEIGEPVSFWGNVQPLTGRQLQMKPEGERKWNWIQVFAEPSINLSPDDVIIFLGIQYRVMSKKNFKLYGYVAFELVEDYTGAGPQPEVE